jgi:hypothetical protein
MKVVTIATNNAVFIEFQYKTLKKFLQREFEYIVFNDGKDWPDHSNFYDPSLGRKAITDKCNELGIKCYEIPNEQHKFMDSASFRHSQSLNFFLGYMKENIDEYLMIDSDMFLIDYFDLEKYFAKTNACVLQSRLGVEYIWPNFFYMNLKNATNIHLINFNINGGDTGSCMNLWLEDCLKNDKMFKILHLWSLTWDENKLPSNIDKTLLEVLNNDPRNSNGKYFYEIYDEKFLHYRAGTNWMKDSRDLHIKNIERLEKFILSIL